MAMYHCNAVKEDSTLGQIWIEKYPNDICRINGVVFRRFQHECFARMMLGDYWWYARISTTLFPLSDEYYEVA
jgi:hypothetical protein